MELTQEETKLMIIETHAQLVRFVVRGQMSFKEAASFSILHVQFLGNALAREDDYEFHSKAVKDYMRESGKTKNGIE